jgi:hypothetical protein
MIPAQGESWSEKLTRTRHAIRHVGEPMSTHLDRIERRSGD